MNNADIQGAAILAQNNLHRLTRPFERNFVRSIALQVRFRGPDSLLSLSDQQKATLLQIASQFEQPTALAGAGTAGGIDIQYRLIIGLKRARLNGASVLVNPYKSGGLISRGRRSDPHLFAVPFDALCAAQAALLEQNRIIRVVVKGKFLLRPIDGPFYTDEQPAPLTSGGPALSVRAPAAAGEVPLLAGKKPGRRERDGDAIDAPWPLRSGPLVRMTPGAAGGNDTQHPSPAGGTKQATVEYRPSPGAHRASAISRFQERNPGLDLASNEFLKTIEWRRLRMDALELHGARCQCCGASAKTGAVINVDHIFPRKTHPHLALDLNNLQVLCEDCNAGKGNRYTTDWRNNAGAWDGEASPHRH